MAYDVWKNKLETFATDFASDLETQELERKRAVYIAISDLIDFGLGEGYTDNQVKGAVNSLFEAYPGEWSIYILVGSDAIKTAIQNDVTLPWLNTAVGQSTVRAQLIARL